MKDRKSRQLDVSATSAGTGKVFLENGAGNRTDLRERCPEWLIGDRMNGRVFWPTQVRILPSPHDADAPSVRDPRTDGAHSTVRNHRGPRHGYATPHATTGPPIFFVIVGSAPRQCAVRAG